jgi:hypothetical protein
LTTRRSWSLSSRAYANVFDLAHRLSVDAGGPLVALTRVCERLLFTVGAEIGIVEQRIDALGGRRSW